MRQPDPTDQQIISALRARPRSTNKETAALLDLAESTVAQRIKSMGERGVMRVIAQKHVFAGDYQLMAFLFINTSGRTVQSVGADIADQPDVLSVSQGVGNPDMFVWLHARSPDHAYQLTAAIGDIKGIDSIELCVCFKVHKFVSALGDLSAPAKHRADPDDTNSIFAPLAQDGRQSNREVARQLDISEGTVRQRLNKMLQAGEIQFQVVCSPAALGISCSALARITTRTAHTADVIAALRNQECVGFLGEVSGESNLLALINIEDTQALGNVCDNELMSLPGVKNLHVQLLVATTKHQFHYAVFDRQPQTPRRK